MRKQFENLRIGWTNSSPSLLNTRASRIGLNLQLTETNAGGRENGDETPHVPKHLLTRNAGSVMSISAPIDDREDRFFQLVADYLEAAETGMTPDQAAILAGRSELAPELAQFAALLNEVERHIALLRHFTETRPAGIVRQSIGECEILDMAGRAARTAFSKSA